MALDLVPNPDGCTAFEANPFKKDKCKQCGRQWNEHQGVIDPRIVEEFQSAILQKEQDEKQRQEEAARLEKEKKKLKKKAKSADEDQWYMEADEGMVDQDSDDDDEGGFQMISPAALAAKKPSAGQENHRTSIKALIDFGECDVGPEESAPAAASISAPAESAPAESLPGSLLDDFGGPAMGGFMGDEAVGSRDSLVAEVELLQQRLNDMREEKQIEMEICKEEMAIKDDEITSLKQQCDDVKASLRQAEEELERLRSEASAKATTSDEESRSREETLIAALTAAEARAEAEAAAAAAARQELSQVRASQTARVAAADTPTSAEAYAAARQITLQATDAFREIRKNAEQQMAWLRKFLPPEHDLVA